MDLFINNIPVKANKGVTFKELIAEAGVDSKKFEDRPLAVRIGGMIVSLNYIPNGKPMPGGQDRPFLRALGAADGHLTTVSISDGVGYRVYLRSLVFLLLAAVKRLYPTAELHADFGFENAELFTVTPDTIASKDSIREIKQECLRIVNEDIPFIRNRLYIDDAIDLMHTTGYKDCERLLGWRTMPYFDIYRLGDYADYLYGELVPSSGYLSVFDLALDKNKLVLLPPDTDTLKKPTKLPRSDKISGAFRRNADWDRIMHCMTVSDLNECVANGSIRDLVRVNEALHEKEYANIADSVVKKGAKAVLIAGPSSSGKTTSANRLSTQLRVLGKTPISISLDDYYKDRRICRREADGTIDLEHIDCLDTARFREDLSKLIAGKGVVLPRFDFTTATSHPYGGKTVALDANSVVIIEGLHGLNPQMLPDNVDPASLYRVYVSDLTTLNLDSHNRIHSTDHRLLRRMVRDYMTRNRGVCETLTSWDSVRRGEDRWIFPYQEDADTVFNTALAYELAVLKKYVYPLLMNVRADNPCYEPIRSIVKFLNYILEANVEDEIPPTSVLREFIGGNVFYN